MTIEQFLLRVKTFNQDRLQILPNEPQFELALVRTNMVIDEMESFIAGNPYLEATRVPVDTIINEPITPLPEGTLRIDNMVMTRDDGTFYYNLEPINDPVLNSWLGTNRGRPTGYYIQGETITWDPNRPAQVWTVIMSGYFSVDDVENQDDEFPLHDSYANPAAALVARMFEFSRGEDMSEIRSFAHELLGPVMNMRRRRERAPTSGRFRYSNN